MIQHPFEIGPPGQAIRGMTYRPDGEGRFPTVLMLHGFTGQRMETGFLFVQLARALNRQGIAAVTFDFRGSGESDGTFDQMLVSGEIDDALRVTDWLGGQRFADRTRLTLIGMSLGGLVAACVMGRINAFGGLGLIAPTNVENMNRFNRTDPHSTDPVTVGPHTLHEDFFIDRGRLKPVESVKANPKPTLLIQGTADIVVPPNISRVYTDALAEVGKPAVVRMIDGANHAFANPDHRRQLIGAVTDWMG